MTKGALSNQLVFQTLLPRTASFRCIHSLVAIAPPFASSALDIKECPGSRSWLYRKVNPEVREVQKRMLGLSVSRCLGPSVARDQANTG